MSVNSSEVDIERGLDLVEWTGSASGTVDTSTGTFGTSNIAELKAAGGASVKHVVKYITGYLFGADSDDDIKVELRSGTDVLWTGYLGDAAKRGDPVGLVFPGDGLICGANKAVNVYAGGGAGSIFVSVGGASIGA